MDKAQLTSALHHQSLILHEGVVQSSIVAVGLVLAYVFDIRDLTQLYRQGGRRQLWYGAVETFAFFILGFLIVGMLVPSIA